MLLVGKASDEMYKMIPRGFLLSMDSGILFMDGRIDQWTANNNIQGLTIPLRQPIRTSIEEPVSYL